jgi:hypothetical protein
MNTATGERGWSPDEVSSGGTARSSSCCQRAVMIDPRRRFLLIEVQSYRSRKDLPIAGRSDQTGAVGLDRPCR